MAAPCADSPGLAGIGSILRDASRSLSSGAHSRDPLEMLLRMRSKTLLIQLPHGEERVTQASVRSLRKLGYDARLRTMLRIALRTMRPPQNQQKIRANRKTLQHGRRDQRAQSMNTTVLRPLRMTRASR